MGIFGPNGGSLLTALQAGHFYLRPLRIIHGEAAEKAVSVRQGLPIAGSAAFTSCQIIARDKGEVRTEEVTVEAFYSWQREFGLEEESKLQVLLHRLGRQRERVAGSSFFEPVIMGIVNATPDSFSEHGQQKTTEQAITCGRELFEAGAKFIDVGGESTRPGAQHISTEVEQKRVIPIVRGLVADGIPVSIDTYHPETMLAAAENGALIINDVTALTGYADSATVAASTGVATILVHSAKSKIIGPLHARERIAVDVYDYLENRIEAVCASGVKRSKIIVDPGLGFGKTSGENLRVLNWLSLYHGLGCPVMVGASRKFGRLAVGESPRMRLAGSVAAAVYAVSQGVQLIRAHDVSETAQAIGVWSAIHKTAV